MNLFLQYGAVCVVSKLTHAVGQDSISIAELFVPDCTRFMNLPLSDRTGEKPVVRIAISPPWVHSGVLSHSLYWI